MDFLPIFVDLRHQPCLVVGGGDVATRKISMLLRAHAQITVIAPQATPSLHEWVAQQRLQYHARAISDADIDAHPWRLVYAATNDESVNRQVSERAKARGLLINAVDNPPLCNFITPSLIDRSPIQIAVSSGGQSPVLARLLRTRLETLIPAAYGELGALASSFREQVKAAFNTSQEKRIFWENILQGPIAEMVFSGHIDKARAALAKAIEDAAGKPHNLGEVYLVGGGPGDPDLLTFRALRLMQQADVVVHDRLISPAVLDLTRRDAERIYVGKERSNHVVPQEDINQLLVDLAKQGKRVLRLKGGDPFIFGRGGEEIETLAAEGIPFQVVPGITAASGTAAYAGIPLTHRDYAQSCVFVTGHLKDNSMDLNWDLLVQPQQTVAVYMGLGGFAKLCEQLIAHGMPADKPVALVQQATTQNQRVFTGTLQDLPGRVEQIEIKPPTLIIIGDVVKLHQKLAWFKPLAE
jgi:uroporphyrin-III C-methyltransferase / precorrin-2 dehydrogenase / sirohydrochlorin ferrochelatase